jgi:hypothetical protein
MPESLRKLKSIARIPFTKGNKRAVPTPSKNAAPKENMVGIKKYAGLNPN